ncbi:hypothetical protein RB195_018138 [Necator americanus]|uniref:SEFIR domain-containing protein n=1 Tax=Necator americanus TaxID=51031 RepID=A0ABR1CB95_NECAM
MTLFVNPALSYFFTLLFCYLLVVCLCDRCYNSVRINYDENSFSPDSVYSVIGTSEACVSNYEANFYSGAENELPPCRVGLLSVELSPIARFDNNNNLLPYIELNISVTVHEHVDSVVIRLQCVYAPDAEDIYCHDTQRMTNQGRWLWPCRALVFHKKDIVSLPTHFGYSCFRVFGLSQYIVNVTIFPQRCRSTLLITSPSDIQLSPTIAEYYANKDIPSPEWSPLLIVDFSEEDGIWLRVEGPASYHARAITVSIFERHADGALHPLQTFSIVHPDTGLKWRNVAKGDYVAYAHIHRHDCVLVCDDKIIPRMECRLCAHTVLNFTLPIDRASLSWKSLRRMRDSSSSILYALSSAVFVLALFGMIYVFILRRRVRHTPVEVREIELQSKPSVLLLTPDDCDEHALVMLLLSRILERHFGVNVLLDYHEMSNSVARPSRWLVDSMCRASRVLIIVSPCTELVINGQHLKQRRPFPDLFGSAINMILRESTKTTTLSKYIICRLPYSPPTPKQLSLLGFPEVEVPSEFTRLTALVHSIDYEFNDAVDPSLQNELAEAVNRVVKMMKVNPSWIESRCVSENVHNDNTVRFVDVPEKSMLLETSEERREAAVEFGLLPPEENEVVGISSEFALLPPDSSDED